MFMAGMKVRTDVLAKNRKKLIFIALFNGGIPAIVGLVLTSFFGYDLLASMLIGTIFISSSIAVIIPSFEEKGYKTGKGTIQIKVDQEVPTTVIMQILKAKMNKVKRAIK
jgi:Kef-type K+ transport system membrane component KefB